MKNEARHINIRKIYSEITPSSKEIQFNVMAISERCLVSRTKKGDLVLLIPLDEGMAGENEILPFSSISVSYHTDTLISIGKKILRRSVAIIRLPSDYNYAEDLFCTLVNTIRERQIDKRLQLKNWNAVCSYLQEWSNLFERQKQFADTSERGLWGELYVMNMFASKKMALRAWQGPSGGIFDYYEGSYALEIKTTLGSGSMATFKYEQVRSNNHATIYIGLLNIFKDPIDGLSLHDLVRRLRLSKTQNKNLIMKMTKLGYRPNATYARFRSSQFRVFKAEDVRSPLVQTDGIQSVVFESDLNFSTEVSSRELQKLFRKLTTGQVT